MGVKIGIDLGTTFSAVAIFDEKAGKPKIVKNKYGNNITPSVIQFLDNGEIIVGNDAKEAFDEGDRGCVAAFKRGMGSEENFTYFNGKGYTSIDLSSLLLKVLKEDAEKALNEKIEEAVITVPAYFLHKERHATMEAAKKAGLKVRMFINEPTAAALNYGMDHWRENAKILVYDLGGGTFDVTLIQMQKNYQMSCIQTKGNHILGGKDWDKCIYNYLIDLIYTETGVDVNEYIEFLDELLGRVEKIKKDLTTKMQINIKLHVPEYGLFETVFTNEIFEKITYHLLDKTGALCKAILDEIGCTWYDITDILLVGGSTRMPQVSKYLEKISGHKPLVQVNPDEAVALGAAIQTCLPVPSYNVLATIPNENKKRDMILKSEPVKKENKMANVLKVKVDDVQAHALGIIAVNDKGTHYINQNIIPENQNIPVKSARMFQYYTSESEENEVYVYLLQGTKDILDCEILNKYVIYGIRHKKDGPTKIKIQYSYDINGMVHVQARQEDDNFDLPIRKEPIPEDMSMYGKPIPKMEKKFNTHIFQVLDTSYSMNGQPIEDAKNAMRHFVEKLSGKDVSIGIMAVADSTIITSELSKNMNNAIEGINKLQCELAGIANRAHPFDVLYSKMSHLEGKKIAIILADGIWDNPDIAKRAAQKCISSGIDIIAIGFGSANREFLKSISSTDENAIKVEQSQLITSFGNIAQAISENSESRLSGKNENKQNNFVGTWEAVGE